MTIKGNGNFRGGNFPKFGIAPEVVLFRKLGENGVPFATKAARVSDLSVLNCSVVAGLVFFPLIAVSAFACF